MDLILRLEKTVKGCCTVKTMQLKLSKAPTYQWKVTNHELQSRFYKPISRRKTSLWQTPSQNSSACLFSILNLCCDSYSSFRHLPKPCKTQAVRNSHFWKWVCVCLRYMQAISGQKHYLSSHHPVFISKQWSSLKALNDALEHIVGGKQPMRIARFPPI